MKFRLGCELEYRVIEDTVFVFNFEAATLPGQIVLSEQLTTMPDAPHDAVVNRGNGTRYTRISAGVGYFSLKYSALVDLDVRRGEPGGINETPTADLPLSIFPYLLPSRFVPSDRLAAFATREFANLERGYGLVVAICNWIYDNIEYRPGTSDSETTATETLLQRAGVCRDFAHLGVAFCRAVGIPARFVTCYANGLVPSDFHAVFEAYLDGDWWLFDATRQAELDGMVRIGVGRDAAEVAFATPIGNIEAGPIRIWIEREDGTLGVLDRTIDAISNAEPHSSDPS